MLHDLLIFFIFVCITIFSWIISYSDYEELLICYGCKNIQPEYDFVIVGGGTSGCVLARRLAENKSASIIIIEAGGRGNSLLSIPIAGPMLQQSNFDWKYTTTRQTSACLSFEKQRCKFPQGKILGGSHQINNMVYTRGHPDDYTPWFKDMVGYSYDKEIEEYFDRAEQLYGRNETMYKTSSPALISPLRHYSMMSVIIAKAFRLLGYEVAMPSAKFYGGFYRPVVTQKNGRRWTTADHLLEMKLPNVEIVTKATAERIIFKNNNEAVGVKFNYIGTNMMVKAKRALILSAGVIGSPKLLMLSGIGPKDHLIKLGIPLVKDLPVGNNLQDHVTTGFDLLLSNHPLGVSIRDIIHPWSWIDYIFNAKGPWTANGVDLIGFTNQEFWHCKNQIRNNATICRTKYSQKRPDVEFMILPVGLTSDYGIHLRTLVGITDDLWDDYFGKINQTAMTILPILLHPKSRGTVRLANRNPYSKPIINPNYLTHPADRRMLLSVIIQTRKLMDRAKKGNLGIHLYERQLPGCEKHEFGTLCYWDCYLRRMSTSVFHPVGTCKMGSRNDSVVSFDYHVHGLRKLFVVDASVFPTLTSGHIMAPVIMMAERAAEFLKKFKGHDVGMMKDYRF